MISKRTVAVRPARALVSKRLTVHPLRFEASPSRVWEGAELVLLLTEWDEYRRLSPAVAGGVVRRRVVLDGRNVLDAAAWQAEGWVVRGLGTNAGGALEVGGTSELAGTGGLQAAAGPAGMRKP